MVKHSRNSNKEGMHQKLRKSKNAHGVTTSGAGRRCMIYADGGTGLRVDASLRASSCFERNAS